MMKKSQKQRLLELLRKGPKTTYALCVQGFAASYRQRISDLRDEGHVITAITTVVKGQRHTAWLLEEKSLSKEHGLGKNARTARDH